MDPETPEVVEEVPAEEVEEEVSLKDPRFPLEVKYCPNCGSPAEYCIFTKIYDGCKPWLVEQGLLEAEEGMAKLEVTKEPVKKDKKGKAKAVPKVVLAKGARKGNKTITQITGIDSFGLKLKQVAKLCKKKFASSCSVQPNKTNPKHQDVVIQGDWLYDLPKFLFKEFEIPKESMYIFENGKISKLC
eukprot:TRINITY_DN776087_c0_g1_i1.p1 TRINITY_DN776087_c0_g1~~TRINITY_DN776087_c0_g1_i1.p1  ORF type:complete len:196 (+),score=60.65 TRINITY_DN776087_c0_g1_i1:29-589(+)